MDTDLFVVYNAHDIKFNGGACAVCPSPGQSDGGTGNVTSCHVPAGTGGTDSTGTWEYAYDCHFEP